LTKLTGFSAQRFFERRRCDELLPRRAGARARRRAGREVREVVERLVVVLEQLVRAVRVRRAGGAFGSEHVGPCRSSSPARRRRRWRSTSRPSTTPSRRPRAQAVADRRRRLRRQRAPNVPGANGWYGGWIVLTA
jgi:hypothetical protein